MDHTEKLNTSAATTITLKGALTNSHGVWMHIEPVGITPATSVTIEGKMRSSGDSFVSYGNYSLVDGAIQRHIAAPLAVVRITPVGGTLNAWITAGS